MLERRNLPIWPAGRRWAARAAFQTGAPLPRPHPQDDEGEEHPGRARHHGGPAGPEDGAVRLVHAGAEGLRRDQDLHFSISIIQKYYFGDSGCVNGNIKKDSCTRKAKWKAVSERLGMNSEMLFSLP